MKTATTPFFDTVKDIYFVFRMLVQYMLDIFVLFWWDKQCLLSFLCSPPCPAGIMVFLFPFRQALLRPCRFSWKPATLEFLLQMVGGE